MSYVSPSNWRILCSGESDGAWNMALDQAISESVRSGLSPPTLRLYSWTPPTISFGCSQNIETEIDVDACLRHGTGLVRRISGGRAVLHSQELTYSVFARPQDHAAFEGGINSTYEAISRGLVAGLNRLGAEAELCRPKTVKKRMPQLGGAAPCFASTSRSEVVVGGRKLVGSAQRRTGGVVLQHGSILLGPDHLRITDYMRVSDQTRRRLRRQLEANTVSLSQTGWEESKTLQLPGALSQGFAEIFGSVLDIGVVSDLEKARATVLAQDRYSQARWTFKTQGHLEVVENA